MWEMGVSQSPGTTWNPPLSKGELEIGCRAKSCRESEGVPQIMVCCGKPALLPGRCQAKPPTGLKPTLDWIPASARMIRLRRT